MKALHDLVAMGKVHYIGASSMWAYQFAMMQFCAEKNGWTKFVSVSVREGKGGRENVRMKANRIADARTLQLVVQRGREGNE